MPRLTHLRYGALIVALAVLLAVGGESLGQAAATAGGILYVRDGNLHSVRPDGTGDRLVVAMTRDSAADLDNDCVHDSTGGADVCFDIGAAAWSPDRTRIAYVVTHKGLHVARADGTRRRRLVTGYMRSLDWSPVGPDIAYDWESLEPDGLAPRVYVVRAEGSPPPRLLASASWFVWFPRWSPDGRWVSYQVDTEFGSQHSVWVTRADGQERQRIARVPSGTFAAADWSPDSKRLVYNSDSSFSIVNRDGMARRRVAVDVYSPGPRWSPRGNRIAYIDERYCGVDDEGQKVHDGQVAILDLTSGTRRWVAPACEQHRDFRWSPDGTRLLLDVFRHDDSGLFVVRLDGSQRVRVAESGFIRDW